VLKPRSVIDEDDPRVAQIGHPAPPWLINYADLMTELVCFFVILYALSAALSQQVQKAKKELEEVMKKENIQGQVKITKDGMSITLQEQDQKVFFDSGQADLKPEMTGALAKIATSCGTCPKNGKSWWRATPTTCPCTPGRPTNPTGNLHRPRHQRGALSGAGPGREARAYFGRGLR